MEDNKQDSDEIECPFCAEKIKVKAKKCKHCGEALDSQMKVATSSGAASNSREEDTNKNPMSFFKAIKSCFKNYATFSGRASRSEYWYFILFLFITAIPLSIIDTIIDPSTAQSDKHGPLMSVLSLATLIPSFSVSARRLHDVGKDGWCFFRFWLFFKKGNVGVNKYGADPLI